MDLSGHYDEEAGVLAMWIGEKMSSNGYSVDCEWDLVVFTRDGDDRDAVGFEILGSGGKFLHMEDGYDAETDTLTIGDANGDPALTTENGDLVTYWRPDPDEPTGDMEPTGIAVRNAKENIARVRTL